MSSLNAKILIVSNNALSDTSNNGKTIASFFCDFNKNNMYQLYLREELPTNTEYKNYFRITEKDIILRKGGRRISGEENSGEKNRPILVKHKSWNALRLLREVIWFRERWKSKQLDEWLESVNPDIVFFCGGDSGFAYSIVEYICNKYDVKLITYFTDDYILPRKAESLLSKARREFVLNKMKRIIGISSLFYTISDEMRIEYLRIFKKDSYILCNSANIFCNDCSNFFEEEHITLVYAGGLHYNRFKTLVSLANSLEEYNKMNCEVKKAHLYIYSGAKLTSEDLKKINTESSTFCGFANREEMIRILNSCDIPVFIESFDSDMIENTRLSFSTKITEYLSLRKPILAIGPEEISSMKALKDSAYCINDENELKQKLALFLTNTELQIKLAQKCELVYKKKYKKELLNSIFSQRIQILLEGEDHESVD